MVMAVIAFGTRVDPVLGIAVAVAVWGATSWIVPFRTVEGVEGWRHLPSRALFGEEVEATLEIHASSRVPWLAVTDTHPFDFGESRRWVTTLAAGQTRTHTVVFRAAKRGLHRIGPAVAVGGDAFGARTVQRTVVPASTILVYPRIVPLETVELAAGAPLPLIPTRVPLYEDPTRVVGVREYQAGDPMRRVHWSATAASGVLQVKQLRHAVARDVVVLVDLGKDSHPSPGRRRSAELAVTVGASLVDHLVVQRAEAAGLRILAHDTPTGRSSVTAVSPGRDQARLARMLEHLARSDLTDLEGLDSLFQPATLPFGSSVVLVTGRADRRHVLGVMGLRKLGMSVTVVLTASEFHRDDGGLERLGVPVRHVGRLAEMVGL